MKELPILFSTPMIRAILDGRKVVTRRVISIDPSIKVTAVGRSVFTPEGQWSIRGEFTDSDGSPYGEKFIKCRQGTKGDVLWCRETYDTTLSQNEDQQYYYKADVPDNQWKHAKWKPSIFMPKAAARIWLLNKGVRVERLHDITEEDAVREGIEPDPTGMESDGVMEWMNYKNYLFEKKGDPFVFRFVSPLESFQSLWISINGQESWDANPWVFVVNFKVLSINGKPK